ncbi:TonB-dependent siderophore receptor [Roseateles sp. BYS180W]|uniref:TonB-dependent siderophore receptor n=1 Tax=Roseateles rivi TaxID=3299028 RepID=A0ABW7FYM1_9BURK
MSGHRFLLQPKPVTLATLALLCSAHAASWAQTQAPATQTQAEEASLPTIKARAKRESSGYTASQSRSATGLNLSLRDTPQAVSVITRERMDDAGMATMADVFRSVPGLSVVGNDSGRSTISARGFDVENLRLDGMPLETSWGYLERLATPAFESVEVTRGATGLTAGEGNPSATISMVRKRAQARALTGQLRLALGTQALKSGTLDLSTALNSTGSVRARVVAHAEHRDGHLDLEQRRTHQFFVTAEADLSSATRLTLGHLYNRSAIDGGYWGGLPLYYSDGSRTHFKRGATTGVRWNEWYETLNSTFVKLEHQLSNDWRVQAELSRDHGDAHYKMVWATGEVDRKTGLGLTGIPYFWEPRPHQLNAMVGLQGKFQAWGHSHQVFAGLQRLSAPGGWKNRDLVGDPPAMESLHQWTGNWTPPAVSEVYNGGDRQTTQTAVYVASRLQIRDDARVILGMRLSDYRFKQEVGAWNPEPYGIRHKNVLTPYGGLVWDLSSGVSAYLSHSSIFKHQAAQDRHGKYLDPIEGVSQELGLKGEWLGGDLQASATAFRIEQNNYAVPDPGYKVPGTADDAMRGVRGVNSRGVELELTGQLQPNWKLGASLSHFRVSHPEGEVVLAHVPRTLFKLHAQHRLSGVLQGWHVGAELQWQGSDRYEAENPASKAQEAIGQKAYGLLGLTARWDVTPKWQLQLNVDNALDQHYRQMHAWSPTYMDGAPRSIKLGLSGRI